MIRGYISWKIIIYTDSFIIHMHYNIFVTPINRNSMHCTIWIHIDIVEETTVKV